ncbi:MAG: ketol-acid reductoisomerase [Deltaproteobacteria bacterium]|nr:ketol-acid reductoisomerase [Deltaproteobacteria bacterium]
MHVTIFGYGSQGRAHALNLSESGWDITVVLRPESPSISIAKQDGVEVITDAISTACKTEICALLLPDLAQPELWREVLVTHLPTNSAILFAHGYAIHYGLITPRADLDIILAGPMCPGTELRNRYVARDSVPIVTAIQQDHSGHAAERLRAYVDGITGGRHDVIESTFAEETETDLFSEQALLCGGLGYLVQAVYELLVEAGYNPKLAHYTAMTEPVNLARLIAAHGVDGMLDRISHVARYGARTRGPRIIDTRVRQTLRTILAEIRSGSFQRELAEATKTQS